MTETLTTFNNTLEFAQAMDQCDPLSKFREEFHFPILHGRRAIYFCGNSLGLQPKRLKPILDKELNDWAQHAVEGHLKEQDPWFSYHEGLKEASAYLTGAMPDEVVIMNSLTVNLHLMMVSFYRPQGKKFKILCEGGAFPSDQYALESQVRFHGHHPEEAIIEALPKEGSLILETQDILDLIEKHKDELALVLFGGVNYYTGQRYDMQAITEAASSHGIITGFDLAHAVGNVELKLHDWGVDFAVWCSYKYLNSGPGGVGGAFVHERHSANKELPRFAGWWGYEPHSRFMMKKGFIPAVGADGWQLSNCPILSMAALKSSLVLFQEAGINRLFEKRDLLTAYLEYLIHDFNKRKRDLIRIITPEDKKQRGSQLSLIMKTDGKIIFDRLAEKSILCDWREPDVIRISPVHMYNSFEDVYRFAEALHEIIPA